MTPEEALAKAIEIAGGPTVVGKAFDPPISSQAVSQWKVAPPKRVKRLAELARGEVTEHDLAPELFGPQPAVNSNEGRAAA